MDTSTYAPPVDKLLTYGSLEDEVSDQWPDYLALGLGPEHIPELIRMAKDKELRNIEAEDTGEDDLSFWAPVHAVRALGQLRAEAAIEPLLPLFDEALDDEWMVEDLVRVYGMIGSAAIPTLVGYLADTSHSENARGYASDALPEISDRYPQTRSEVVAALTRQLESFEENDYDLNSFLISDLIQLKAVEAAPTIEQVFAADRVDEILTGNWDDVQVSLGLKERVEVPRRVLDFGQLFKHDIQPRAEEDISPLPAVSPRSPLKFSAAHKKSKNKNKMAKQSRKKNRRRK